MAKRSAETGAIFGLGLIGSAVYFISTAEGFWFGLQSWHLSCFS